MKRYFLQRAVSRSSRKTGFFPPVSLVYLADSLLLEMRWQAADHDLCGEANQRCPPHLAFGKSKSGNLRSTSQHQLGKRASTTGRRKPGTGFAFWSHLNESRKCKYFGFVMTLLLFTGAVAVVILYFHKQRKMMDKPDAMRVIREFMILQNKSFQGKSDSEILDGAQRLAEYLLQLKSRSDEIEKASRNIIQRLIDRWKPFSGNLYYFSSTTVPAATAQELCEKQGGYLTDVTSRAEEEYLENEVDHRAESHLIGLRKIGSQWLWLTDKPLTTSYWAENHPDGSGLCVIIVKCRLKGRCWNSADCSQVRRWICKLKPNPEYL